MKAIVLSIVARLLIILFVLGFTFAMFYVTRNYNTLYLLFLILTCMFIPVYTYKDSEVKHE